MQSLLLSKIIGHAFWSTDYDLRFGREKWTDQLSFFVARGANFGWKKLALDSDPEAPHFEQICMKICISGPFWRQNLAWKFCPPKGLFLSLVRPSVEFSSRDIAGIMMSIINVRKLSKSFNDFPRFTQLVLGGARLSGAWRGPSSILGMVSCQCMGSRVSEVQIYSQGGNPISQRGCPRQAGGRWWQDDWGWGKKMTTWGFWPEGRVTPPTQMTVPRGQVASHWQGRSAGQSQPEQRCWGVDSSWLPGTLGKLLDFSEPQLLLCKMNWIIIPDGKGSGWLDEKMGAKHLAQSLGHGCIQYRFLKMCAVKNEQAGELEAIRRHAACLGTRMVLGVTSKNNKEPLRGRSSLFVIVFNRSLKIRQNKHIHTHTHVHAQTHTQIG